MKTLVRKALLVGSLSFGLLAITAAPAHADQIAVDNGGILSGNNVQLGVSAAIPICGNGIGILGLGLGFGQCSANAVNDFSETNTFSFISSSSDSDKSDDKSDNKSDDKSDSDKSDSHSSHSNKSNSDKSDK